MSKEKLRSANASYDSLGLLRLRFGTLICILFHVVLSNFPSVVRIVLLHRLEGFQRIGSEVLFINDPIGANQERHHSCYSILRGRGSQGESANHCATGDKIYFSSRRCRSLSL